MKQREALERLHRIVDGIDADNSENENGWWPNSVGAEFGLAKLRELERLVTDLSDG